MIVYHGSIRKFHHFENETVVQKKLPNDIDTIGTWFTSDIHSSKPFALGTETVIEKSDTEFWEDGEPKVVQYDKPVQGYVYKVYVGEPHIKDFESYNLFMEERDKYCDYLGKKRNITWLDKAILLNKEEANKALRQKLINHAYASFVIRNMNLDGKTTDLYCFFGEDILQIADVIPVPVDSID
jgi:hypothetical protein